MQQSAGIEYKDDDLQFTTHVFDRILPEWLENLLGVTVGLRIFKIKSLPREWVRTTHGLRHFKIHSP